MRMYLKVMMEVHTSNQAIANGKMAVIIGDFAKKFKPEGMWFIAEDGKRCMITIFDLASTSQIAAIAEPFFLGLGAAIEITPAMDLADLQAGLSAL